METTEKTWEVAKREIAAEFTAGGITAEVGKPRAHVEPAWGKDGKPWHCVAWEIWFRGRGAAHRVEWKSGTACVDWAKAKATIRENTNNGDIVAAINSIVKTPGIRFANQDLQRRALDAALALGCLKPGAVDPAEVFATVCRDAVEAHDCGFDDWAANIGIDTDSRKAEAMHRGLCEDFHRLVKLAGETAVCRLAELACEL